MTSLGELREALDKIDNEIAELYEKRMEVCRKVGEYKVKSGKKVFDRQREKEKLADVMSKVEGDFNKKGIQELYQQLMSMSRSFSTVSLWKRERWDAFRLSESKIWIVKMPVLYFREQKELIHRLQCISFSEEM